MSFGGGNDDVAEEMSYLAERSVQPDGLSGEAAAQAADLIRVLMDLGASPGETRAVIAEVFSPPRVTAAAARFPQFEALPGGAYDLRPGLGGKAWDFDRPEDRAEAERRIEQSSPYLLVGSPPCTDWCALNKSLNHPRMGPAEVVERRRRARAHLSCVVKLYLRQLARGGLPPRAPGNGGFMG